MFENNFCLVESDGKFGLSFYGIEIKCKIRKQF